eukprot:535135-Amphidinium_carterae.1
MKKEPNCLKEQELAELMMAASSWVRHKYAKEEEFEPIIVDVMARLNSHPDRFTEESLANMFCAVVELRFSKKDAKPFVVAL